jgi:hypothetical protein
MKSLILMAVLLAGGLLPQAAPPQAPDPKAGSSPQPVAVVLSQPIQESEILPRQLAALIQKRLLEDYAKRHHLEPTEAELRPLLRSSEEAHSKETAAAMARVRQRRTEETRKKLEAPDLSPADRERLTAELAEWERFPTRPEALEGNREMMVALVQNWKVQRSLYRKYGGRVLVSSFGFNVAIDAQTRFLQDEEKKGSFKIFDPGLRAAFWQAATDETWADGVAAGRNAEEAFATPPWRLRDRRP